MATKTLRKSSGRMINLSMSKRHFVDLFRTMEETDREDIYEELKKILFLSKINKLRDSLIDSPLTMEEITEEVESVRKERYEAGRQIVG